MNEQSGSAYQSWVTRRWERLPGPVVVFLGLLACGPDGTGSGKGAGTPAEVTVAVESGVVFETGEIVKGNKFNQVDLVLTANGEGGPRAATGGEKSTVNEPANWFKGGGGMYQTFGSLDEVPRTLPEAGDTGICPNVKAHYGFVVRNLVSPGHTVGWVREASASSLTISYQLID